MIQLSLFFISIFNSNSKSQLEGPSKRKGEVGRETGKQENGKMGKNNVEEVGVRREEQVGREEEKKQIRQR